MEKGVARLRTRPGVKYKVGCDAQAADGKIAFVGARGERHFLLMLRFPIDRGGTYVDQPFLGGPVANGDPVQAYNDPGIGDLAFCELEAHAPAVKLRPGESQEFEIEMSVAFGGTHSLAELARVELAQSLEETDLFVG
jgi:hypothetical protein